MASAASRRASDDDGSTVLEGLQGVGTSAKRMATDSYEAVRDKASEMFEQGKDKARQLGETVQNQVRDQPVKAVLIAAGIGFALHRLPIGSLLWSHVKLLWALAPPAVMMAAAGKGLCALQDKIHENDTGLAGTRGATSLVGAP